MYFLDFDRTLFDTDAYNASLADEPGCAPFREDILKVLSQKRDDTLVPPAERARVWGLVSEAIKSGALSFPPGYLERFLYADVAETLRSLGNEAVIITYGEEARQRLKIESALANAVRVTVLYTGDLSKANYLSSWPGYYGQEAAMVEDRTAELEALAEKFPKMKLFKIERGARPPQSIEGAPSFESEGRWKTIHSLAELP